MADKKNIKTKKNTNCAKNTTVKITYFNLKLPSNLGRMRGSGPISTGSSSSINKKQINNKIPKIIF